VRLFYRNGIAGCNLLILVWPIRYYQQRAEVWFDFIFFAIAEIELMRERFAKLLLGEDMSGGGQGTCTAAAISNAITNLSG